MMSVPLTLPPSTADATGVVAAIGTINYCFSKVCVLPDDQLSFENPRRVLGFAKRLQLVINQLLRLWPSPSEALPTSVQTALRGISGDLAKAVETLCVYDNSSRIFVLINCQLLCASLQEHTVAIGGWLALIDSSLHDSPELRKKASDLSKDMKLVQFRVTKNEERLRCVLEKERQGKLTSKAVQSAIIMDLARALGIDPENHVELTEQIKLFKNDLSHSNVVSERKILVSLDRILDNWSDESRISTRKMDFDFEDDASMLPFKNFLCPLTKEIMKDPVVLESFQTYERTAIQYWFETCTEDGRDRTCPVTGQSIESSELKPNIGLAGAIEEWANRITDYQVKSAVQHLSREPQPLSVDAIEKVLDDIYKISEENPISRHKIRNAGIVLLIVKVLRNNSKIVGTLLRSKALLALHSMSKDEESRAIMIEEGITRLAIHSLIGRSEKEREYGVKLLMELSKDEASCVRLASEKGSLVLLSSMAGNLDYPALSNLAGGVLKQMERVEGNVQLLAAAGRFEPLLTRLCEGSDSVKIKMASLVGSMSLTNSSKEAIARQSAKVLVDLLSKQEGKAPSLQALSNLSALVDNASTLVDSDALPSLISILFETGDLSSEFKELAASTIANIVSKPGCWELAFVDSKGHSMQSKTIILGLVELLRGTSLRCQASVLQILCGLTSSPQASESVCSVIKSRDGLSVILTFLDCPELEHRVYAYKLARVLSEWFGQDLGNALRIADKVALIKAKLLDNNSSDTERSDAASILANVHLSESEVKTLLGPHFMGWVVTTLKNQQCERISRTESGMVDGLLGLLLHFTRTLDHQTLGAVKEHRLMTVFCEQLNISSKASVKRFAAIGLKNLSEFARSFANGEREYQPPHGFFSFLTFMCGSTSSRHPTCSVHNSSCDEGNQLCLLKCNCIRPLVYLLSDDDTNVQIAAVEALSTLILESATSFRRGMDELEALGVVDAVVTVFTEAQSAELREKAIWVIEKILREENHAHRHSLNQSLLRGLVEAFKHGNANTRKHAQDALTNLKQISGVSAKTSTQFRAGR